MYPAVVPFVREYPVKAGVFMSDKIRNLDLSQGGLAKLQANPQLISSIDLFSSIQRWLEIREQEGKPVLPEHFQSEADNSLHGGLLSWILSSRLPFHHLHPLNQQIPVVDLHLHRGFVGEVEIHKYNDTVIIAQNRWQLLSEQPGPVYIIEWNQPKHQKRPWGRWRVVRVGDGVIFNRWRLEPLDTPFNPTQENPFG